MEFLQESRIVLPGQVIPTEAGFLRGHGTYLSKVDGMRATGADAEDGDSGRGGNGSVLIAAAGGAVSHVSKLVTVRAVEGGRYSGEVGDLVVARISAVENKRWKADVGGVRDAVLQLSSVHLPGGEQRMRNAEDQLQMRALFCEGDCVSAEIQSINAAEGVASLHTRSLKYGKLENGLLVQVPPGLVRRLPQHYVSLPVATVRRGADGTESTSVNQMDVVLGKNGFIWITRSIPEAWKAHVSMTVGSSSSSGSGSGCAGAGGGVDVEEGGDDSEVALSLAESLELLRKRHRETPLSLSERIDAARIRNCVRVLGGRGLPVTPENIAALLRHTSGGEGEGEGAERKFSAKDLLVPANVDALLERL